MLNGNLEAIDMRSFESDKVLSPSSKSKTEQCSSRTKKACAKHYIHISGAENYFDLYDAIIQINAVLFEL